MFDVIDLDALCVICLCWCLCGCTHHNFIHVHPEPHKRTRSSHATTHVTLYSPYCAVFKYRKVMKDPTRGFVGSFGYVSLFPFLLKLVDATSNKLEHTLDSINKTEVR